MNRFGGQWTQEKIEIFMKYVPAYLTIMNQYAPRFNWELLYVDGFAGSGAILAEGESGTGEAYSLIEGVAKQVLQISDPCRFDYYYFIEKDTANAGRLQTMITEQFSDIPANVQVVTSDFNEEIKKITNRMRALEGRKGKTIKALVFIDPYGMSVEWESVASMSGLGIDMWMLIPSGIGANRLLPTNFEKVDENWVRRLSRFFGIKPDEITSHFYRKELNLFGENMVKELNAIKLVHQLYERQLKTIFKFVSAPFIMQNSRGAVMYHFLACIQ
jgi:three-Cys-motif partner protein